MGAGPEGRRGTFGWLARFERWLSPWPSSSLHLSFDRGRPTGSIGGAIGSAQGTVTVVHSDGRAEAARSGMPVEAADRVETGLGGAASITYNGGSSGALNSNTTVDVQKSQGGSNGMLPLTASQ